MSPLCSQVSPSHREIPRRVTAVPGLGATPSAPEAPTEQNRRESCDPNDHATTGEDEREATDAATILEYISWGKRKQVSYSVQLARPTNGHLDDTEDDNPCADSHMPPLVLLQMTLPAREKVYQLVDYHIDRLLWFHNSFHASSFRTELDAFYDTYNGDVTSPGIDMQWLALFFAILLGSMTCADEIHMRQWGFRHSEQSMLAREWLKGVTTLLNIGQYMAVPTLTACMTITTLTMSAHLLGASNAQAVLLKALDSIVLTIRNPDPWRENWVVGCGHSCVNRTGSPYHSRSAIS
jgi:hypothetical protein